MAQSVNAVFDTYEQASRAIDRVRREGVEEHDISVISNDPQIDRSRYEGGGEGGEAVAAGAGVGAVAGGSAGLLAGMGLLTIPGLGPVVAAGWLGATLAGVGAGGAAGGLVGTFIGSGSSEDDAHAYAEGIRRGSTIVNVRVSDAMATRVRHLLSEGSYDLSARSRSWRNDGWSGRTSD